jgi:hypothetical protein
VIFNPALAILQQRLDHLEKVPVSRSDVERAAMYLRCAVTFYEDEARRQDAIQELVDEAIGEKGEWGLVLGWADKIKPGGSWWYDGFLILVLKLKNTSGLSRDALLKAVVDYSKIVSMSHICRFEFPCLTLVCSSSACGSSVIFPIVLVDATCKITSKFPVAVCDLR